MALSPKQEDTCSNPPASYGDLKALFLNCTLKRTPELSNTEELMKVSMEIMRRNGVAVECLRPVDHAITFGVYPDMREHGWEHDDWPPIQDRVMAADILVIGTPIWLGEESAVCRSVIERLYGFSGVLNDKGQYAYYGRVGACVITGNEDGIKHCAMSILYAFSIWATRSHPRPIAAGSAKRAPAPPTQTRAPGGLRTTSPSATPRS